MSQPVRWSSDTLTDLAEQITYIGAENPSTVHRVADTTDKTALALGGMPTGRSARVT